MKTTATLPLPLELAQPVAMASDLDTLLTESLDVGNTRYDPESQMGAPEMHHRRNRTNSKCVNFGLIQIDDILQDF